MAAANFTDRKRSQELRKLVLDDLIVLFKTPKNEMDSDTHELYKEVLKRLSGTVLPRLNEHTGEDGEAIKTISQINYIFPNGDNSQTRPETTPSVPSA